ncbi:hypothetical protein ACOKFD_05640 [Flagellimonas sp. S174]|uniref:hypothetical protein n=1 Tax=Flagellimonas sp. S174 TaxID=3410790 RepID=UPI003BF5737A
MSFEDRLTGGHPNSLGNTLEVVEEVLQNPLLFDDFFNCYFSKDEVVRLRVSNGIKRICKANKSIVLPYLDRLLNEISKIEQASTQWTLAQLFLMLEKDLSTTQKSKAQEILKKNLAAHSDWIVLNQTMETLGKWAEKDGVLKEWIIPYLNRLVQDERKSVSKKASKILQRLS